VTHDSSNPEGKTPEAPSPAEIGKPGTPGEGLTPEVPHPADAELVEHGEPPADPVPVSTTSHHDDVTHMDKHASLSDDDHGHGGEALGPVDWGKWAFAIAGAIAGVIVLAFFVFALGGIPG
jgi:hypothetical protein